MAINFIKTQNDHKKATEIFCTIVELINPIRPSNCLWLTYEYIMNKHTSSPVSMLSSGSVTFYVFYFPPEVLALLALKKYFFCEAKFDHLIIF